MMVHYLIVTVYYVRLRFSLKVTLECFVLMVIILLAPWQLSFVNIAICVLPAFIYVVNNYDDKLVKSIFKWKDKGLH